MTIINSNLNIIIIGLALLLAAVVIWLVLIEARLRNFFRGKKAVDLESIFKDMGSVLDGLNKKAQDFQKHFEDVERRLKKSVQNVGIVRFNPYADSGGDQSFVIALLDEHKNGVVISSLYGRDSNRIYSKKIVDGKSEHRLSDEEQQAIDKALLKDKD